MTMTDLGASYNIIVQYLKQKQQLSKFASCKPRYIFLGSAAMFAGVVWLVMCLSVLF